jgi:ADP-heptose:LPS heptosyltransferase
MSAARKLIVNLIKPMRKRDPMTREELDKVKSLLIVRAHDQLGDFLIATPAIHALTRRFPGAEITLVTNQFLEPVALYNPDVDRGIVAPWRTSPTKPDRILEVRKVLRKRKYDLAVVLNTVSHSLTSDVLARISGAKCVTGPLRPELKDMPGAPLYDWAYDPALPKSPHQIDKALAAVAPLGCPTDSVEYRFALEDREKEVGIRLRNAMPVGHTVAIHIGTKDPEKRYPIDQWVEAVDRISELTEAHIVLFHAPDAVEETKELANRMTAPHTKLRPLKIREAASLLSQVDALVCHDSAFLHLAAAVGTASVSIHGRGSFDEWKPPGESHVALQAEDSVPAHVSPTDIAQETAKLVAPRRSDPFTKEIPATRSSG